MGEPPFAEITRVGRWLYYITVHHGMVEVSPGWFAYGRWRAERKAARVLRWYVRAEQRRHPKIIVMPPPPWPAAQHPTVEEKTR